MQSYLKNNEKWKLKLVDRHRVYLKSNDADKYLSVVTSPPMGNQQLASPGAVSDSSASLLGPAVLSGSLSAALALSSPVPNHSHNIFFIRPKKSAKDEQAHNKITIHAFDGRFVVIKDFASGVITLSEDSLAQAWKYEEIDDNKDKDLAPSTYSPPVLCFCVHDLRCDCMMKHPT